MVHLPPFENGSQPAGWSLELLRSLDWLMFEKLCGEIAKVRGFDPHMTGPGPDGGIDILLRKPGEPPSRGYTVAVQCKRWKGIVEADVVSEFSRVLKQRQFEEGYFVTTSGFTDEARYEFDYRDDMHLIDGERVLRRIQELGEEEEQRLLEFATGAEDWYVPTCYQCDTKLVERVVEDDYGARAFWGCVNFPKTGCRTMQWVA